MNLISRYIIRQMAVMAVYALLAFLALYSFFEIINEVGDLGKGSYNGATMAQYVLMQMPARAYELMPLAVLIGGLEGGVMLSHLYDDPEPLQAAIRHLHHYVEHDLRRHAPEDGTP